MVTNFWYNTELSCLLGDGKYYERVDVVPFQKMKSMLLSILKRYGSCIGEKLSAYILQFTDNCCPAYFNILPKVHKYPLVGRPIVASTKYLTTPASCFVDSVLAPCLPSLPSFLKDSTDLSTIYVTYLLLQEVTLLQLMFHLCIQTFLYRTASHLLICFAELWVVPALLW